MKRAKPVSTHESPKQRRHIPLRNIYAIVPVVMLIEGEMVMRSKLLGTALPLFVAAVLCSGCMQSTRTAASSDIATTKPTLSTLEPGEAVLYDDGNCPSGQVAQFARRSGQAQMRRSCVVRPI